MTSSLSLIHACYYCARPHIVLDCQYSCLANHLNGYFSFQFFSMINVFAASAIAKTSAWKTVAYYVFQMEKNLIGMRAVRVEAHTSSSV